MYKPVKGVEGMGFVYMLGSRVIIQSEDNVVINRENGKLNMQIKLGREWDSNPLALLVGLLF
jgi:hypothetical protein